ncbi:hypothetical protein DFH08DRAFT_1089558 [Mycena albidolilacea]|uniref:Mug135-like C-terminal domain-containing protein n=1 Tax=Mycena albidolilacea TaxID=1033008 RepID=A0AAD6Z140_9AGAR|nr:hypothetical protein DFH08DRAFT_1089558 [Mycena albidolilacea]
MTEVALTLDAIAASNQALNRRLDMLNTRLDGLQREAAINSNIAKGTGLRIPYTEVLFLDGSQPTVATAAAPAQGAQPARPGHPILPLLSNVAAIRNLTGPDATHYLIGYGIAQIPHLVQERQVLVARCIGCVIDIACTIWVLYFLTPRHILDLTYCLVCGTKTNQHTFGAVWESDTSAAARRRRVCTRPQWQPAASSCVDVYIAPEEHAADAAIGLVRVSSPYAAARRWANRGWMW